MSIQQPASNAKTVRFQTDYGRLRKNAWWLGAVAGAIGIVAVPLGFIFNKGWTFSIHPLDPWAATLMIECFAAVALLVPFYMALLAWYHGKSPQRVAVTDSSLIVPKRPLSKKELVLPLAEMETTLFNLGFVRQLQIKCGRKKVLLVSSMFPSDEEFNRFLHHVL